MHMKNYDFTYLDDLIHDDKNQITLKHDIILSYDDIMKKYPKNICIDVDNLVIDGNGHVIDGKNFARIFYVTSSNVILKNLTIKNGDSSKDGGSILNEGNLTLINCFIEDSYAINGGAIFNNRGFINIINSMFSNNLAKYDGGAILNTGELIIKGSTFFENRGNMGGAISNIKKVTVKDTLFVDNLVLDDEPLGGTIQNYHRGNIKVVSSIFSLRIKNDHPMINNDSIISIKKSVFIDFHNLKKENIIKSSDDENLHMKFCRFYNKRKLYKLFIFIHLLKHKLYDYRYGN